MQEFVDAQEMLSSGRYPELFEFSGVTCVSVKVLPLYCMTLPPLSTTMQNVDVTQDRSVADWPVSGRDWAADMPFVDEYVK